MLCACDIKIAVKGTVHPPSEIWRRSVTGGGPGTCQSKMSEEDVLTKRTAQIAPNDRPETSHGDRRCSFGEVTARRVTGNLPPVKEDFNSAFFLSGGTICPRSPSTNVLEVSSSIFAYQYLVLIHRCCQTLRTTTDNPVRAGLWIRTLRLSE